MSGQSIPEKEGCAPTYPVATMPAEDEKLSDIAIIATAGCRRPARDQCKASEPSSGANEKGQPGLRF
jgi:hypothetical protein